MRGGEAIALGLMLVVALGARLQKIGEPPLDSAVTRQYRGMATARACYYSTADVPEWRRRLANLERDRLGVLEPRILEALACAAYRIGGAERPWIGRVFSVVFWLIGGILLFRLARDHVAPEGALLAAGTYLFLPFAILSSRGFQPDPLMVALLVASALAIARHDRDPSGRRLAAAALFSAAAMFVKPTCLFAILGAFLALAVRRSGLRQGLTGRTTLTFVLAALAPCALYTAYNVVFLGPLRGQMRVSFVPHLWFAASFWSGWWALAGKAVGITALLLSAGGVALARGASRALLVGLWLGYFAFGLAFTYHIHTHGYYQMQLVPIVALSLGALAAPVVRRLASSRAGVVALAGAGVLGVVLSVWTASQRIGRADAAERVRTYEEIGRAVGHSPSTVDLSEDYGHPLRYHGEIAGWKWPRANDLRAYSLLRVEAPGTEERLRDFVEKDRAEFFVVTELDELAAQPELKRLLETRYRKLAETDRYVIYDLAHPRD